MFKIHIIKAIIKIKNTIITIVVIIYIKSLKMIHLFQRTIKYVMLYYEYQ